MTLSPKQIDMLEPGDRLYWRRTYVMGNTNMRAQSIEYFVVDRVVRDPTTGEVMEVYYVVGDRDCRRSRTRLRQYAIYHPTPKRVPFDTEERHTERVAKAKARAAQERAVWRARMKVKKNLDALLKKGGG